MVKGEYHTNYRYLEARYLPDGHGDVEERLEKKQGVNQHQGLRASQKAWPKEVAPHNAA